jgi:hypothetical protein
MNKKDLESTSSSLLHKKGTQNYKTIFKKVLEAHNIYKKYRFVTIRSKFEMLITEFRKDKNVNVFYWEFVKLIYKSLVWASVIIFDSY